MAVLASFLIVRKGCGVKRNFICLLPASRGAVGIMGAGLFLIGRVRSSRRGVLASFFGRALRL